MNLVNFEKPDKVVMQKASDNQGTFEFAPLERGYGVTIGNALRRTLLSSLEGYAITSLRIEGVEHEFASIQGVYEDMVEIILNLKQVRFKKLDESVDDEEKINISISGKEQFVSKEISKASNNYQVLNDDLVICHMEPSVKLNIELNVSKGRGYVPAEEHKPEGESPLGFIAMDAVFTPIKNVKFNVENTRVGQSVDYDKLTLDVTTDGSVHPEEAIKQASNILIQHFNIFAQNNIEADFSAAGVSENMDEKYLHTRKLLKTSLSEFDISVRAYNCLRAAGIETLGDLVKHEMNDLLKFRNFGKKSYKELEQIVESKGLKFGMDVDQYRLNEE